MKLCIIMNWEGIAAIVALLAFLATCYFSYQTHQQQKQITIHSVRPVLHVGYGDFENRLIVQLENKGTGVAMITLIQILDKNTHERRNTVYDWLPKSLAADMNYKYYLSLHKCFPIALGEKTILIEVLLDEKKNEQCLVREELRTNLSKLRLEVNYKDIYGNEMDQLVWDFDYFSRTDNVNRQPVADSS